MKAQLWNTDFQKAYFRNANVWNADFRSA
ncbi:pentapeptide repeat-containing protein [Candidatus Micrarchaeota archaeon]|nr:pentapeptide repeat-containing protein [Candidatus Micrarchaeota archaeon]